MRGYEWRPHPSSGRRQLRNRRCLRRSIRWKKEKEREGGQEAFWQTCLPSSRAAYDCNPDEYEVHKAAYIRVPRFTATNLFLIKRSLYPEQSRQSPLPCRLRGAIFASLKEKNARARGCFGEPSIDNTGLLFPSTSPRFFPSLSPR